MTEAVATNREKTFKTHSREGLTEKVTFNKSVLSEMQRWLSWQCCMLSGVESGAVVLHPSSPQELLTLWPSADIEPSRLKKTAISSMNRGKTVCHKATVERAGHSQVLEYLALPVSVKKQPLGAVVVALKIRPDNQLQAVRQLLQWGVAWLENVLLKALNEQPAIKHLALQSVGNLLDAAPLAVTVYQHCNYLSERFDCHRVAIGLCSGLRVKISGLSHHLQFDGRTESVRQLELAMEECVDQGGPIYYEASDSARETKYLTNAHAALTAGIKDSIVCSLPLRQGDVIVGCITLNRTKAERFTANELELLSQIAQYTGPALALKAASEHSLARQFLLRLNKFFGRLFGAGNLQLKLLTASGLLTLAALTLISGNYTVVARSEIEGSVQQIISAPFAGYIETVEIRPGDRVEKNQVLASLESRELLLEQEQGNSDRDRLTKEYHQALAAGDRAEIGIMQERLFQAEARLNLISQKLQRAQLKAPFAGVLINGDLSQSLGRPVELGQKLFEVSPLDEFRVVLQVDEIDIEGVKPGQHGAIRLTGFPDTPIEAVVTRVVPVATEKAEGTFFRVEAALKNPAMTIQPGMKGVARIVTGQQPLYKVWCQSLYDRVRLWLWSVGL